jgi:hypothetical protein
MILVRLPDRDGEEAYHITSAKVILAFWLASVDCLQDVDIGNLLRK